MVVRRGFLRRETGKGEIGLGTWYGSSREEWLRKYRILARDKGKVVGESQLCWNNSSSSLQRRSWLSIVLKNASLEDKRHLLWEKQHSVTRDNYSSMFLLSHWC